MIMGFGKYKLVDIEDVPADYLIWCLGQEWFEESYPKQYAWIKKRRKKIERDLEEYEAWRDEIGADFDY